MVVAAVITAQIAEHEKRQRDRGRGPVEVLVIDSVDTSEFRD
jgi:hypothetical protein